MRITSKGQVTIPIEIRETLGLRPGTEVEFKVVGLTVYIREAQSSKRGESLVPRLSGCGDVRMSTDEILAITRT